ncbi:regulatory protein RecX [Ectothiorhodospiraceae bacterium 2226]|nr:regulatory protein RecX [Ectothiorhodospiraceae bacterium 2226]
MSEAPPDAYARALRLLAGRDHSAYELRLKLVQRGCTDEAIEAALSRLSAERYLDEWRYAEAYVASRADKGVGPLRIAAELAERRVPEAAASHALREAKVDWAALAARVRARRFGAPPDELHERAKQQRFLQGRGFDYGQIRAAFAPPADD